MGVKGFLWIQVLPSGVSTTHVRRSKEIRSNEVETSTSRVRPNGKTGSHYVTEKDRVERYSLMEDGVSCLKFRVF